MIIPITAPRKIFPPNTRAALIPIRIGKNTNAALLNRWMIVYDPEFAIAGNILLKPSSSPIKRPLATIAGMIGTNTSPSVLIIRLKIFCFAVAACFTSSLVAAVMPAIAINSS